MTRALTSASRQPCAGSDVSTLRRCVCGSDGRCLCLCFCRSLTRRWSCKCLCVCECVTRVCRVMFMLIMTALETAINLSLRVSVRKVNTVMRECSNRSLTQSNQGPRFNNFWTKPLITCNTICVFGTVRVFNFCQKSVMFHAGCCHFQLNSLFNFFSRHRDIKIHSSKKFKVMIKNKNT